MKGNKIIVVIDDGGLSLRCDRDEPIQGFQIAAADRKWMWAGAKFVGRNKIAVTHPAIDHPVAARYGWAQYRTWANVCNDYEIPLETFRTDDWQPEQFPLRDSNPPGSRQRHVLYWSRYFPVNFTALRD